MDMKLHSHKIMGYDYLSMPEPQCGFKPVLELGMGE